jgi:flagellar protein FlaI
MSAPESVLGLVAENRLKNRIDELRQMKNVEIDVNPTKEALVPRPSPTDAVKQEVASLLAENDAVGEFAGDDVGFDEALPEEGPTADAEPNDTAVMADGDMSSDGGVTGEFDDDSLSDEVYGILAGDEMDVDDDGEESEQLDSVGGFGAGGDGTDDEPAEDSVASAMGLDDDGDDEGE